MCGAVGFQGDFPEELLGRMTQAVAHRGPDDSRTLLIDVSGQRRTGLGHRRLAIIDLSSAGAQPMAVAPDAGGAMLNGLTLVYNGEIYNYRELRSELVAKGHRFSSGTDSEVLLHLYEDQGLEMLHRLNGIFAFAIHDARERGRPAGVQRGSLFIARDHLGVKPMYWAQTPRGFLFGSEMKAVLQAEDVPRDLDPVALHQTLAYLWTPAPRTMLEAVRKLPPGAAMIVDEGRVTREWSYYTQPYNGARVRGSEEELSAQLARRVETAVQRQLMADVPVGAFLSGGLDSSAVVAMMRRAMPDRSITCFSIGVEGALDGSPADLPYARRVAAHLGVDLREILIEPGAIRRLEDIVRLLDEPQADPAPINALVIAERARAMGIPVLLSGAGGDDLLGGYRRHWALSFERRWAWLPRFARAGLQRSARWLGTSAGQSNTVVRRLTKMFSHAAADDDRRIVAYFLWSTDTLRRGLYSPDFARRTADADEFEPLLDSLRHIPHERDRLQRMLFLEVRHFLADHNLNYTDRAGMAVGVEVRVPLLDLELVEFATRLPSRMKQRGRMGKPLLKKAMEPYLPREVIYRAKTGFGVPLRRWLRTELLAMVDDALSCDAVSRRGVFDPQAVHRLIAMDRAGSVDGSYTIFALLSFELWCRSFIDRVPDHTLPAVIA